MPATTTIWFCTACEYETDVFSDRCPRCRSSLLSRVGNDPQTSPFRRRPVEELERDVRREATGFPAMDAALGGGLVAGSSLLLHGDGGVGKSTLLTQVAGAVARRNVNGALYVTAEENEALFRERCRRLDIPLPWATRLWFLESDDVTEIMAEAAGVRLLVVDSIQAILDSREEGYPGGPRQIVACTVRLDRWAKRTGIPVMLLARESKDGTMAGPNAIRHEVDAVLGLAFGDEPGHRELTTEKNRWGPAPLAHRLVLEAAGFAPEAHRVDPGSTASASSHTPRSSVSDGGPNRPANPPARHGRDEAAARRTSPG